LKGILNISGFGLTAKNEQLQPEAFACNAQAATPNQLPTAGFPPVS
jgi:hypothetical protein